LIARSLFLFCVFCSFLVGVFILFFCRLMIADLWHDLLLFF